MSASDFDARIATDRQISRRRVLQSAATVGAVAAAGPLAYTRSALAQESTPAPEGETPRSGGTVILGYIDEPPTMDPRVSGSAKATNLLVNVFDTLVSLDRETGEILPGLATSWEASEDGASYTFHLRDDVLFHDGTPFNAEAVKYTFDSIMDPELKSLTAIGYLGPYDNTEVVDEFTVTVNFSEPYAAFMNTVSTTPLAPVSPTAAESMGPVEFARAPVGTGPFKMTDWQQQVSMTFERNPDYNWPVGVYKHEGPAYIDQLVVNFIPEASTLTGSLSSGQLTIADGILPQDIAGFQSNPEFQVLLPSVPGSPQILPINAAKFPTDDLAVRQAINYAIDTETIIDTLFFGTLKPAKGPLASSTWTYNPAVEEYFPYDPERATQLLTDAGWVMGSGGVLEKDGQPLVLEYITTSGQAADVAELVQAYLSMVGIQTNLQILEYAATAELMLDGAHHIARIGYTGTDPIALSTLYHSRNIPGTNFNRTMKPDPALDEMLDAAASETDREARAQMYMDIQTYIMDQALLIPLWEQTIFWGASAKLRGLHPMALGQIPFYDAWLAE
jgi:peptide/nickel transport system substrate-binding protein